MSKKPRNPVKRKRIPKSVQLARAVSRRFLNSDQELAIQTTAGVIRDAVKAKGGHNSPRVPYKKNDDLRDKKVPYGPARWGTLVSNVRSSLLPKAVRGQSPKVAKQLAKAESYKAKITSRKWRKAAGDR